MSMDASRKWRIALVTTQPLDGPPSGGRLRLEATAEGLAALGELRIFTVAVHEGAGRPAGIAQVAVRFQRLSRWAYGRWLITGRQPPQLAGFRGRLALAELEAFEPDLVWFYTPIPSHIVDWPRGARVIIDVNDLEGRKDAHRRSAHASDAGQARRLFDRFAGWRVRSTWDRHYAALRRRGAGLVACSEDDARRVAGVVVPNGYPLPTCAASEPAQVDRPRLVFVGRLTYAPNRDAVDELLSSIWPRIVSQVPDATLSIVGAGAERWGRELWPDGVEFLGEVESIEEHLAGRLATVIPLRSGGGTRLKVLEAFAHQIPVVATAVGVEGLECVSGIHFLLAETPDEFAQAIQRLTDEEALRVRLTTSAAELLAKRYGFEAARAAATRVGQGALPPPCRLDDSGVWIESFKRAGDSGDGEATLRSLPNLGAFIKRCSSRVVVHCPRQVGRRSRRKGSATNGVGQRRNAATGESDHGEAASPRLDHRYTERLRPTRVNIHIGGEQLLLRPSSVAPADQGHVPFEPSLLDLALQALSLRAVADDSETGIR